jgi:PmbA protein
MEEILARASKAADEAEVFLATSEDTPVRFEANRLKNVQSSQSASVSLRVIKNGKIGYAAASGPVDSQELIDNAVETSQYGLPAKFEFPPLTSYPQISLLDPHVSSISLKEMIGLGEKMIAPVMQSTPGILCDGGVSRGVMTVKIMNSRGGQASYTKSIFSLGVEGTLIRDTDMLFVGEGQSSCRPITDISPIIATVLRQLELSRNVASVSTGQLPVIFTPDGAASALIPALMSAFNGKLVLEGASPIGGKLGQTLFDAKLSLYDDATVPYAPHSRPCDDEGVPSRKVPLIEKGVVRNFFYDLQTAGMAGARSTGSASRGRGGIMAPSPSALFIPPGAMSFDDMVWDIKEGLIVEQLMGAEQGNVLGGDFSGNVLLGYKIENGKITGRVKNTMVSGNIYQVLKEIAAIGKETKWVGASLNIPHLYCPRLSVSSK